MKDRSHDEAMAAQFFGDPAYAQTLLNELLKDDARDELAIFLRQIRGRIGGEGANVTIAREDGHE